MTLTTLTPSTAFTVVHLPPAFASAWSPGFDLHVRGEGETPDEAYDDLVRNLRSLAVMLNERADEVERT